MNGKIVAFLVALNALPVFAAGGFSRTVASTDRTPNAGAETRAADTSSRTLNASRGASGASRDASESNRTSTTRRVVRTISVNNDSAATRAGTRVADTTRIANASDGARTNVIERAINGGRSTRMDTATSAPRRPGLTLRPSATENSKTNSNTDEIKNLTSSRIATLRTREEQQLDPAAIAQAKDRLEQTAELNKSCQEQYNDCMDQFCAVIDANQKRCSCSANLSKYAKVEKAVKDANAQLNEVAQNIRYVGLSADEISAIMSATEAEEALSNTTDTTESRSMLDEIEKMIKDPTTTSSSNFSSDSYGLLDIDLDFSDDDLSDMFSLDFLNNSGRGFSNMRGTELYNAAKKRCNTVITQCKDVGATAQQITGNYDLAIDKDCIAYEQGLTKMNETLVSNVRSATRMLQKARLAVLQNQNTYNARECIGALENCMTDDMVCGENYTKCLDPTKMYIDENGNVVLGKNINTIQNFMTNYNNADINLAAANSVTIGESSCGDDGRCVVKYLLSKIGTKQKATDEGLCRPVLDKCRAYTYDANGNYMPYNDIVLNYIQRAMVNIKAAQYQIVSDYASTCLTDIASCYNDQVSQITSWSATAAADSVYNIMRGACRNVALTCGYAVFSDDSTSCHNADTCIKNISQIFYQSLLCPDNSEYQISEAPHAIEDNNTVGGWVNKMCKCKDDFTVFNGSCLPVCPDSGVYSATGVCTQSSCPVGASEATGNDVQFWGHCKCNNSNAFWVASKTSCNTCPDNSTRKTDLTGNILDNNCQCNENYVPKTSSFACQKCPDGSNQSGNTCECPTGQTYNRSCNKCFTTGATIVSCVEKTSPSSQVSTNN